VLLVSRLLCGANKKSRDNPCFCGSHKPFDWRRCASTAHIVSLNFASHLGIAGAFKEKAMNSDELHNKLSKDAAGSVRPHMVSSSKPTFVFVHGAWHGGWCWSETVRWLAEQGYRSVVVDLPGHGMQAKFPAAYFAQPQDLSALATEMSPLASVTLTDYCNHVLAMLQGLHREGSGPLILVGHSLGGATLSMAAELAPELIRQLVYLTAFVPVKHDSVIAYLSRPEFASSRVPPLFSANPEIVAAVRINHKSTDATYVAQCHAAFYNDMSAEAFPAIANLLTPDEPIQAFAQQFKLTEARWGTVQRAYIRCTMDQAIPIAGQDAMIAEADAMMPAKKFIQKTLHTGHSPFASDPKALAQTLISLV
jgi:pimeloyl-ACP methyl ester carboxylesterase